MEAPSTPPAQGEAVYQLKILLKYSKPPIWRRVLVTDSTTLSTLHTIIQLSMGWNDSHHLHEFTIQGKSYGQKKWQDDETRNEAKYKLHQVVKGRANLKFTYMYDFGDSWTHEILVEKVLSRDKNGVYPLCTKGKLACPLEDCSGLGGHYAIVEAMKDPSHPRSAQWLNLLRNLQSGRGGVFDPNKFDVAAVNAELRAIRE